MTAKTQEDIQGYEFDWLAIDKMGYVALFTTAGGGYAPQAFLDDTDAYDQAIDAILNLPAICSAKTAPKIADDSQNTWKQMAERGIYAFDSDPWGGPYSVCATPSKPVLLEELTVEVAAIAARVKLITVQFNQINEISESEIIKATSTNSSK